MSAKGTKSLMSGERPSVRLPKRMVPIWVSEPMGCPMPALMASTPAITVVATAPMPGIRTPSLPVAGAMDSGWFTGVSFCIEELWHSPQDKVEASIHWAN